jgi:hypothetical protein
MIREGSATAGWALHTKRVNIVIPGAAGRRHPGIKAAGFKRPTAWIPAFAGMTMMNSAFFSANATQHCFSLKPASHLSCLKRNKEFTPFVLKKPFTRKFNSIPSFNHTDMQPVSPVGGAGPAVST